MTPTESAEIKRLCKSIIEATEFDFELADTDWQKVREIADNAAASVKAAHEFPEHRVRTVAEEIVRTHAEAFKAETVTRADVNRVVDAALKTATGRSIVKSVQDGERVPLPELRDVDRFYVTDTACGKRIALAIRQKRHLMVSGPSGSGKTFPIEQELRRATRRYLKVSVADGLSYSDFICKQDVRATDQGTETVWRLGFLPFAMENGLGLILDEIDQMQPEQLSVLNAALEYGEILIPQTGQVIKAAAGFQVFMTCNTLRDTTGTYSGYRLSAALLNRVVFAKADYLTAAEEIGILRRVGADQHLAPLLVELFGKLREAYLGGRLTQAPSTRLAVRVARCTLGHDDEGTQVADPMTALAALEYCLLDGMPANEYQEAAKVIAPYATRLSNH